MVTIFHNRLGLSLSKCIKHGFIAKINDKKRSPNYEALSRISTDYSRARRTSAPSPRLTTPHPTCPDQPASLCVCFSFSPLLHTLVSAYRATHLISRFSSTSISKVELKSYHPPCINVLLRFIRNSLWARPNNSNNPPLDLKVPSRTLSHPLLFYIPVFEWRLLS
jgi:hypothetical protein